MSSNTESEAIQALTAGQMLRQARLKAGVHLAVLSVHLKVPVKQLEALEADDLDPLKGPVFYRGLTASVCRQLGVDAAPILQLLPRLSGHLEPVKRLDLPTSGLSANFNRDPSHRQNFPSGLLWLAGILVALIAFFVWMPAATPWLEQHLHSFSFFNRPNSEQVTQEISLQMPPGGMAGQVTTAEVKEASSPSGTPSLAEASATSTQMPPAQAASLPNAPKQEASPSSGMAEWVFTASAESWLELRNAKDVVIWSGFLNAGDTRRIESPLPVRVVVGRAQVVRVTLRGQVVDLKPHTQATVARFEVKE